MTAQPPGPDRSGLPATSPPGPHRGTSGVGLPTGGPEVRWLGHSTTVVDLDGTRVLTDPVLRDRVGHLRRRAGSSDHGTPVDVVTVSHLHHDHLDLPSLRRLPAEVPVVVPRGAGRLVGAAVAGEVVEMVVGDTLGVGELTITAVPADHHPGRFLSRTRAEPLGFVISAQSGTVYFPGDTDLHPVMADLPAPDVALLPIWGWGPTLGSHHLDPVRAGHAAELLRARSVLPVHWGTFAPVGLGRRPDGWFDRPVRWFAEEMQRRAPEVTLHLVPPGSAPVVIDPAPLRLPQAVREEGLDHGH